MRMPLWYRVSTERKLSLAQQRPSAEKVKAPRSACSWLDPTESVRHSNCMAVASGDQPLRAMSELRTGSNQVKGKPSLAPFW